MHRMVWIRCLWRRCLGGWIQRFFLRHCNMRLSTEQWFPSYSWIQGTTKILRLVLSHTLNKKILNVFSYCNNLQACIGLPQWLLSMLSFLLQRVVLRKPYLATCAWKGNSSCKNRLITDFAHISHFLYISRLSYVPYSCCLLFIILMT